MMWIRTYKPILILFTFACVTRAAYNFFKQKKKVRKSLPKEIHDVLFFASGTDELRKSKYSRCMITKSMDKLLSYLNQTRRNIDICMYVITNVDIVNAILKLHFRGVKIRVIVDADMAFTSGSSIRRLAKHGIPVRWMKSTNLMHHKICIVDASVESSVDSVTPFIVTGSLNWTNQALCGNWESVVVTSQPELVRGCKEQFELLWETFKPIV